MFFERYPAPGYRHPYGGTLYSVGQSGYSWSSTVSGGSARYLGCSHGGINPQNNLSRAHGFPVRCLQE